MTPTTTPHPFIPAPAAAGAGSGGTQDPAAAEMRNARAKRAEAQRRIDDDARVEKEAQRELFTAVRLWAICPARLCRRQKACRGDTARCLRERWQPVVPPEFKALLQKIFAAQSDGMTLPEAIAAAQASMAAHRRASESEAAAAAKPFVPADTAPSNSPFVPAKAGTQFVAEELDARFRGHERKTEPAQFTIAEPPPPPPVTRASPLRRGPRITCL